MSNDKRVEELETEKRVLLDIIDNLQNHTQLHWRHKPENMAISLQQGVPFVKHVKDYSDAVDTASSKSPAHALIKGDNLATVMALQATHKESVDVIYIDPPYNTGNKDFVYNDSFMDKESPYRHANWLSFMESRLRLARELLADTGVIMVAIGQDEDARLRLLLDQIFDEKNYIGEVYWYGGNKNDHRFLSVGTDSMFIYAKSKKTLVAKNVKFRTIKPGLDVMLAKAKELWEKSDHNSEVATASYRVWFKKLPARHPAKQLKANAGYNSIDDKGRLYSTSDMSWPGHGGPKYDVLHPVTGQPVAIPVRGWRVIEKTMEKYISEGILKFGKTHKNSLSKKIFLESTSGIIMNNVITVPRSRANKIVASMIGKNKFNYPKDHNVLAQWIDYVTPEFRKKESASKPIIVLDFFAGSGSTGHAVLELNAKDEVNRQFILATNNEGGIAEDVTLPRLLVAMTGNWSDNKKHKALGGVLREFDIVDTPEGMINPETFLSDEQSLCVDDSCLLGGASIDSCDELIASWEKSTDFLTPRHWIDVEKFRN